METSKASRDREMGTAPIFRSLKFLSIQITSFEKSTLINSFAYPHSNDIPAT
ncbi:hypothetical protein [Chitinophaga sp. 212800010-3]|uniref:hypothetical protein n=1 Tax=unclassified Chitinophaga TaxID=2619133 RepID=UPI002DF545D7|nr:hypothetical protein [Chitinophaga sp. 212800010-3]